MRKERFYETIQNSIKTMVTLVLVLTMICTLTACAFASPESKAEKYFNALVAGDIETLADCKLPLQKSTSSAFKNLSKGLTNSLLNSNIDDSGMNAIAGTILAGLFSGYEFEITGSEINGESAEVYFDIYINGKLSMSNQYLPLTKYNGEWYVTLSGYLD